MKLFANITHIKPSRLIVELHYSVFVGGFILDNRNPSTKESFILFILHMH